MALFIEAPTRIPEDSSRPKVIDELVGRVNSNSREVSIAMMRSPEGWASQAKRRNSTSARWFSQEHFA